MTDDIHPSLKATAADRAETALRALTSSVDVAVPGLGSIFGELISRVIPNTRQERFEAFLTRLSRRLAQTNQRLDDLIDRLGASQKAIFEEGAESAVRATVPERIDRLARIVAQGMTADEAEAERGRTLIQLIDQLSESDLLFLDRFVGRMGPDPRGDQGAQFWTRPTANFRSEEGRQAFNNYQEKIEEVRALDEYRISKLITLNLLDQRIQLLPGDARASRMLNDLPPAPTMHKEAPRLTSLGRLVLERAGLGQKDWDGVLRREEEARRRTEQL